MSPRGHIWHEELISWILYHVICMLKYMSILFVKYYQKIEKINNMVVLGSLVVVDSLVATIVALGRILIVVVTMVLSDNVVNAVITSIDRDLIMSNVLM